MAFRSLPKQRILLLALLLVLVAVWLPRAFKLDQFVTSDESRWLIRSGNFLQALSTGEFEQTFQHGHPGVTIMWLGTAGYQLEYPEYTQEAPGQFGWKDNLYEEFIEAQGRHPLDLLAAGRFMVVLANVIVLSLAFLIWIRIAGLGAGLLGFLLLALDPFELAFARFLHPDSLLYSLMLLAALGSMGVRGWTHKPTERWQFLGISGIAAGLAWLTKTPALFLIPFCGLTFFVNAIIQLATTYNAEPANNNEQANIKTVFRWSAISFGTWLLIGGATFILCWPAMWVAPIETMSRVLDISAEYAAGGHDNPIYFESDTFFGDPGMKFYPISIWWRTTPIVQVGLLLGIVLWIATALWTWLATKQTQQRDEGSKTFDDSSRFLLVLAFILLFTIAMSLGAKKFDRYLLPVYPMLSLAAGIGWYRFGEQITRRFALSKRQPFLLGLGAAIVAIQALIALPHFPYYISYYNPLIGGGEVAKSTLSIGWGEGMDAAARYLNGVSDNPNELTVASWHQRSPFSYFFDGESIPLEFFWSADYAVLYASQQQRMLPARQVNAFFARQEPTEQIMLGGTNYAEIYEVDALTERFGVTWQSGGESVIELASYTLFPGIVEPNSEQELILHLVNRGPLDRNFNILVRIVNQAGDELLRADQWPFGAATKDWSAGELWLDKHIVTIPTDVTPGLYRVEVSFYDPATLDRLPAFSNSNESLLGDTVILDYLNIEDRALGSTSSAPMAPLNPVDPPANLGGFAKITGFSLSGEEANSDSYSAGDVIHLRLQWEGIGFSPQNMTTFVHLIGPDNTLQAQSDRPPLDGFIPTSLWAPELSAEDSYAIQLPEDAAGTYRILVGLYDPATDSRLPIQQTGAVPVDALELVTISIKKQENSQ